MRKNKSYALLVMILGISSLMVCASQSDPKPQGAIKETDKSWLNRTIAMAEKRKGTLLTIMGVAVALIIYDGRSQWPDGITKETLQKLLPGSVGEVVKNTGKWGQCDLHRLPGHLRRFGYVQSGCSPVRHLVDTGKWQADARAYAHGKPSICLRLYDHGARLRSWVKGRWQSQ